MNTNFIFVFISFCVTIPHTVNCIHCWSCTSLLDPKCADPFDNTTDYLFQCKDKVIDGILTHAKFCRKIRQKIEGNWRTYRGCAYSGEPGEGSGNEDVCLIVEGTYDVYSEYCTCVSKSGCNVANLLVVYDKAIILGVITAILLTQLSTTDSLRIASQVRGLFKL